MAMTKAAANFVQRGGGAAVSGLVVKAAKRRCKKWLAGVPTAGPGRNNSAFILPATRPFSAAGRGQWLLWVWNPPTTEGQSTCYHPRYWDGKQRPVVLTSIATSGRINHDPLLKQTIGVVAS